MARSSRTVCVLIPFLLTLATLVLTILVFAGNTSSNAASRPFYFVKVDTSDFVAQDVGVKLKDWYTVGLWNYCSGNAQSTKPTHCSHPQAFYWFNPLAVWNLEDTVVEQLIGQQVHDGLDAYHAATKWLFIAYIAAIAANAATLLMSAFAFCRRLGSVFTSIVAIAAMVFTCGAAATATVVYLALIGFIKTNFVQYNLSASLGGPMFTIVWLAAAGSVAACLFWVCSACCCSGEPKEKTLRRTDTYQRVPSPMPGSHYDAYGTPQGQYGWPGQKGYGNDYGYGHNSGYGYGHGYTKSADAEAVPLQSYHTRTTSV